MNKNKLYVVPTPIGNLEDITLRAVRTLKECDIILVEDTRTSGRLLKHLQIDKPMKSFHAFNEHKKLEEIISLLGNGKIIALISDAGTPGISDPGFSIIRACIQNEIAVECLPGATALIPALISSGLPSDRFVFEGFLPPKKGRKTRLLSLENETRTMVFYESPHKLLRTLSDFIEVFGGNRKATVAREISKLYEEIFRGDLSTTLQHFSDKNIKGEFVLIVAGVISEKSQKNSIIS